MSGKAILKYSNTTFMKSYLKIISRNCYYTNLRFVHCSNLLCTNKGISLLSDKYNPGKIEKHWCAWWEKNDFFRNTNSSKKFVLILPPPNVTGHLHVGHAFTCSIQDALARWKQMNGYDVVWIPGCDHAGIATQRIVETHLLNTLKLSRKELGREKFIKEAWKWAGEKETRIYTQLRRLGVMLDWPRAVFTMDPKMSTAVTEAFVRLYDAGMIYHSEVIISWCCELQSVISDIEVEHKQLNEPTSITLNGYDKPIEFGYMYDIAYRLHMSDEKVVVSTTRPETMLGDTALMVNPTDERYKHLHGRKVVHPFRRDLIEIITDTTVDPKFGTGVVKVTPAHSLEDSEIGRRHNLPEINMLNDDGTINAAGTEFHGQLRFTAREGIIKALSQLHLYFGRKPHTMTLPLCSRTQDVIEPLMKPQWFIRCKEMYEKAELAVTDGSLKIEPSYQKNVWADWLKTKDKDWCISRQLYWGHRLPIYHVCLYDTERQTVVAAHSVMEACKKAADKLGIPETMISTIKQSDDVLDTWFSSALFPFAALGWPSNTPDLSKYFPTSMLITGRDILFFWVLKMVMLGQKLTGELPFKEVFAHGLVFDANGKKMSKSVGNVIDPMDIIARADALANYTKEDLRDLSHTTNTNAVPIVDPLGLTVPCGSDALRYTLCSLELKHEVVKLDPKLLENNCRFANKIWNTVRYFSMIQGDIPGSTNHLKNPNPDDKVNLSMMDRWILSKMSRMVEQMNHCFSTGDLNIALKHFHSFWYDNLCDVYVEYCKFVSLQGSLECKHKMLSTLWCSIMTGVLTVSPFMPCLAEELYQHLPQSHDKQQSIFQCSYPQTEQWQWCQDSDLDTQVQTMLHIASAIRGLKLSYNISSKQITGTVVSEDSTVINGWSELSNTLEHLSRVSSMFLTVGGTSVLPEKSAVYLLPESPTAVCLHLEGIIDPKVELNRLSARLNKLKINEEKLFEHIAHKRFTRLSVDRQDKIRNNLDVVTEKIQQIQILIKNFENF